MGAAPLLDHIAFCSSTEGGTTSFSTSCSACSANNAEIFLFSITLKVTKPRITNTITMTAII